MTATNTADRVRELQDQATIIGRDHGRTHAAFVDAYGGDPYAKPDLPPWFATADFTTIADFYTAVDLYTVAYVAGVTAYFDDTAED